MTATIVMIIGTLAIGSGCPIRVSVWTATAVSVVDQQGAPLEAECVFTTHKADTGERVHEPKSSGPSIEGRNYVPIDPPLEIGRYDIVVSCKAGDVLSGEKTFAGVVVDRVGGDIDLGQIELSATR